MRLDMIKEMNELREARELKGLTEAKLDKEIIEAIKKAILDGFSSDAFKIWIEEMEDGVIDYVKGQKKDEWIDNKYSKEVKYVQKKAIVAFSKVAKSIIKSI